MYVTGTSRTLAATLVIACTHTTCTRSNVLRWNRPFLPKASSQPRTNSSYIFCRPGRGLTGTSLYWFGVGIEGSTLCGSHAKLSLTFWWWWMGKETSTPYSSVDTSAAIGLLVRRSDNEAIAQIRWKEEEEEAVIINILTQERLKWSLHKTSGLWKWGLLSPFSSS